MNQENNQTNVSDTAAKPLDNAIKDKIFRALFVILSSPNSAQLERINTADKPITREPREMLRLMPPDAERCRTLIAFLLGTIKESFTLELTEAEYDKALSELPDFKRDGECWTLAGLHYGFLAPVIENDLTTGLRRYKSIDDEKPFQFQPKRFDAANRDAAPADEPGAVTTELPRNFVLSNTGVYYLDPTGEREKAFVCEPLRITALTRDAENNSWGKQLDFSDPDGFEHSIVLPSSILSGDGAELRARLLDAGLFITASKRSREKLNEYVLSAKPARRVLCVNQLGWHDGAFVLPDAVISQEPADIRLQNVDRASHKYKVSGTLAEWQNNISRYCVGNPRLMFAVSTAFAASLLPIAEEPSGGFHLRGLSSTGKTTALQIAGSVWGGDARKGFLETWRATSNGLEAVAELHNNALLCLDEISQINPQDIGETIYCLSNGFGKSRMTRDTKARRKTEWQLLFLSSGEKSLSEMLQGTGQRSFGGQEARFVDLEADAGKDLGLFENLHDFTTASEFSKHLANASRKFYGAAIREFLPHVANNQEAVAKDIKQFRKDFTEPYRDAAGEVSRVASRFALVAVAGMLASDCGVTNWRKLDVCNAVVDLFQEWLDARGTTGSIDVARGVRQVFAWIEQHGASRLQWLHDKEAKIQNRAGFKVRISDDETEYFFLAEMFEREVCKGFNHSAVAKELERQGFLKRGNEKQTLMKRETLPELGRKRVYVVTSNAQTHEADA